MSEPKDDFMECDTCRAKPGTPLLCEGCLHNRRVIGKLIERLAKNQPDVRRRISTPADIGPRHLSTCEIGMTISGKICVKCCVELRPVKTGATILERLPDSKIAAVWLGDIWGCPDCKQQVVIGIGAGPVLSRFQFTNDNDWLTALRERCSHEPPAERVSCWHNPKARDAALECETSQARREAGTE